MNCNYCRDTKKVNDGGIMIDCYCTKKEQPAQIDESKLYIIAKEIDSLVSRVEALEQKLSEKKTRKKKAEKQAEKESVEQCAAE